MRKKFFWKRMTRFFFPKDLRKLCDEYKDESRSLVNPIKDENDLLLPPILRMTDFGERVLGCVIKEEKLKLFQNHDDFLKNKAFSKGELMIECDLRGIEFEKCRELLLEMSFAYLD